MRKKFLRGIARFTFLMHENGIEFLDHSPGNSLMKINPNGDYDFYLVDLNRMKFYQSMSFEKRIMNMQKLTASKEMTQIISNEYAKLYGQPEEKVFESLWKSTQDFQHRFIRKQALKKKFKFWKQ